MLLYHGVGAGGIDDIEVAQKIDRKIAFDQLGRDIDRFFHLAVAKNADAIGCRQHAGLGEFAAEKRI